ncbi:MAG: restriction endonuclease subunit S [Candidatus Tectomicrobia bacterium]|nr:restriction endonuclease subunit S [Candidatus Tectomicrobia bacterium]
MVKRTGSEELDAFLKGLQEYEPDIRIAALNEIAEVFSGVGYDRQGSTEEKGKPGFGSGIALVRVGDVQKGEIKSPSLLLTDKGLNRVRDEHRLRVGDLLVTASGTVGKIGLVRENLVGSIPANSLLVIRLKKDVQPRFLLRLLQSGLYQDWLKGHALGTTIQHLSARALRSLQIPIPPAHIQNRIGVDLAPNADASEALRAFVTGQTTDEAASFLLSDQSIRNLLAEPEQFDEIEISRRFNALVGALHPWRDRAAYSQISDKGLTTWLIQIAELSGNLRDAFELPRSAERLAMLESLRVPMAKLRNILPDVRSSIRQRVEVITDAIEYTLESERQRILEHIEISAQLEPAILDAGRSSEVIIRLKNEGTLPLRAFHVQTQPELGEADFKLFQSGKDISWAVIVSPRPAGTYSMPVQWNAIRFDGEPISGEIPLAFEVRTLRAASKSDDLGDNPYSISSPVESPKMFFGRRSLLDQIRRQLSAEHRANVILLEGNRRTGKTSVLKYLERPGELPGWIPVYCSFQSAGGDSEKAGLRTFQIFYTMARFLATAVYKAGYPIEIPGIGAVESGRLFGFELLKALDRYFTTDHPFELFEILLARWLEMIRPKRVLLMLDEFDKLQEGIDNGLTSPQVPENIRYVFHTYPGLSGIVTGSRRLKRLREEYWSALFGLGHRIGLGPLEFQEAQDLVSKPVAGRLVYVPKARDQVVILCARQPFLIQSLCNRIFEYCARNGEKTVTLSIVKAASDEMITDNEHFRTLWDYGGTERRRFILCLCDRLNEEPDRVSVDLLTTRLEEYGIIMGERETIGDDLDFLRELELLELDTSGPVPSYRLGIPLMAQWLRKHIDWEDIRKRAVREGQEKTL